MSRKDLWLLVAGLALLGYLFTDDGDDGDGPGGPEPLPTPPEKEVLHAR